MTADDLGHRLNEIAARFLATRDRIDAEHDARGVRQHEHAIAEASVPGRETLRVLAEHDAEIDRLEDIARAHRAALAEMDEALRLSTH